MARFILQPRSEIQVPLVTEYLTKVVWTSISAFGNLALWAYFQSYS